MDLAKLQLHQRNGGETVAMKKTWHPQEVTLTNLNNSVAIVNNDFNYSIEDILILGLETLKEMIKIEGGEK